MEKLFCKTREEWREWLEANHDSVKEIWLVYNKKHIKKQSVYYDEAVEEALCFGWIDSTIKSIDDETYMQKYTPRNDNSKWSLVNKKRVEKLIHEGKMTLAGMKKIEKAKQNGNWEEAYTSAKIMKIPDYLEKSLKTNPIAWKNFTSLAPSYQNIYMGWVMTAKRPETREKRILTVIERCEKNLKPGML